MLNVFDRKHLPDSIGPLELRAETLRFAFRNENLVNNRRDAVPEDLAAIREFLQLWNQPSLKLVISRVREY